MSLIQLDKDFCTNNKSLISIHVQDTILLNNIIEYLDQLKTQVHDLTNSVSLFNVTLTDINNKVNNLMAGQVELNTALDAAFAALSQEITEIAAALAAIPGVDLTAEVARVEALKTAIENIIPAPAPVE